MGVARKSTRHLRSCASDSRRSRRYNRRELKIWNGFRELDEGGRIENKNWDTKKVGKVGAWICTAIMSRNLGQGESCYFLMSLQHDILGRTRACPCPVGWLVTYLGNREATRHSQGRCKPEDNGFDDGRSKIVKLDDIGYPGSGPACIGINQWSAPHAEGGGIT